MTRTLYVGALLLAAGCYRAPVRAGPLPGALGAVTPASPREAAVAARDAFNHLGIPLELYLPDSALVESRWLDIAEFRSEAQLYPAAQRVVRFRFLILPDTTRPVTFIFLETLEQSEITRLGSSRNARLVPRDHPAMELARELLERVRRELQN